MERNRRKLAVPLRTDRFRRRVRRARFTDGSDRTVLAFPTEPDPVVGVRTLHRDIPIAGDFVDLNCGLKFAAAKHLKQQLPFLRKLGIIKIPVAKKPMRVSSYHEHLTVTGWKLPELIELLIPTP